MLAFTLSFAPYLCLLSAAWGFAALTSGNQAWQTTYIKWGSMLLITLLTLVLFSLILDLFP